MEQMSDRDFRTQNNPRSNEDFIDHACEAFRRLNTKMDKILEGESSSAQEKRRRKRR